MCEVLYNLTLVTASDKCRSLHKENEWLMSKSLGLSGASARTRQTHGASGKTGRASGPCSSAQTAGHHGGNSVGERSDP